MGIQRINENEGVAPLAIALPIVVDGNLAGSCFIAGSQNGILAIVTTAHQLGNGMNYAVVVPNHGGDISKEQIYPHADLPMLPMHLAIVDYLHDIAILHIIPPNSQQLLIPRIITTPHDVRVGEDVLVVGYPYSVIGSVLETVETSQVSAIGNRVTAFGVSRIEYILSRHSYIGSSGSPVVRKSDGVICGIIRGCLAPPSLIAIGNIPLGTDSSVTYATSAHILPKLILESFERGVPLQ